MAVPDRAVPVADAIVASLSRVVATFDKATATDVAPVRDLVKHVEHYRGKMLRPVMVLACGLATHPRAHEFAAPGAGSAQWASLLTREHVVCAAVVEMVHMATLVHDDVLDEADVRRRGRTVNALAGNEAAVMLGDYMIAAAYALCASLDTPHASREVGDAARVVCSGELLQLSHRGNLALDRESYDRIVDMKTAALIACACRLGAWGSGAPAEVVAALGAFGRDIGVAFQIQDDVLDLTGDESVVGKSVRKDLEKGKLTLPLIHHLATTDNPARSREVLSRLSREGTEQRVEHGADHADALTKELLDAVARTGSVAMAANEAESLVRGAIARLAIVPDTPARDLLVASAEAVVRRAF